MRGCDVVVEESRKRNDVGCVEASAKTLALFGHNIECE